MEALTALALTREALAAKVVLAAEALTGATLAEEALADSMMLPAE